MARPLLDVTDVLFDPLLMDTTLVCSRNVQTVDNNGIASNSNTLTPFAGVVTSANGDMLERSSDGTRVQGNITITTAFPLRVGGVGFDADVITYNGANYTVKAVNDYTGYGRGFVEALCQLFPLSGSN